MLPEVYLQFIILGIELVILVFALYYFLQIKKKERKLSETELKKDGDYHKIVDDALSKEKKILEDAAMESDRILTNTEYVKQTVKEALDQTLAELVKEIQKESVTTANKFMTDYSGSLKQMANASLTDFQTASNGLQTDLQDQIKEFKGKLLPALEKELEDYKNMRLKQTEELVVKIVEKASQDVFSKSISIEDHQKLLTDSLEKAKAEGAFS